MTRSLAIASALFLAVFAGGYFLKISLVGSSGETDGSVRSRSTVAEAAETVESGQDAAVAHPVYRVRTVQGKVERRNDAGLWIPLVSGEFLPANDEIRTDVNSVAVVKLGDSELVLPGESKVTLEEKEGLVTGLRLNYGRASVRVSANDSIQMRFDGSDSEASASNALFSGQNTGDGYVTLTSEEGIVELSAAGESVRIPAGFQSVVAPEHAPSNPREIPSSFFLKVRRPSAKTRARKVVVTGATTPGSVVTIKGVSTHADANGVFSLAVPLREGGNTLEVRATDVLGRKGTKALRRILVDSKAPKVDGDVTW